MEKDKGTETPTHCEVKRGEGKENRVQLWEVQVFLPVEDADQDKWSP